MATDVVCVTVGCFDVAPTDVVPVMSFDAAALSDVTVVVVVGGNEDKDEEVLAVAAVFVFVFVFVSFVVKSVVKTAVEACVASMVCVSSVILVMAVVLVVEVAVVVAVVAVVVMLVMVVFAATFVDGVTAAALVARTMVVVVIVDIGFVVEIAVLEVVFIVVVSLVVVVEAGAVRHRSHFTGHVLDTLVAPVVPAPGNTNASLHSRPATPSPAHSAGSGAPAHTGAHAERRS